MVDTPEAKVTQSKNESISTSWIILLHRKINEYLVIYYLPCNASRQVITFVMKVSHMC